MPNAARAGFVPIVNARKQAKKKRKDGDANATPPPPAVLTKRRRPQGSVCDVTRWSCDVTRRL